MCKTAIKAANTADCEEIMKKALTQFFRDFVLCGTTGWCLEIIFTGLSQLRRRELTMIGQSSLLMFPIYGMAALIRPLSRILCKKPFWVRGITYMGLIFSGEYLSGSLLKKHDLCPWDYAKSRYQIGSIIRLDYAPYWFLAGLLFEHLLKCNCESQTSERTGV